MSGTTPSDTSHSCSHSPFTHRVVVGYDDSDPSRVAAEWAARLAARRGIGLTLLWALPPADLAPAGFGPGMIPPGMPPSFQRLDEAVREVLSERVTALAQEWPGLDVAGEVSTSTPWTAILDASESAVLVVVGSTRQGELRAMVAGSTPERVAAGAHCPLVVIPDDDPEWASEPVLLATDAGGDSAAATGFAAEMAHGLGTSLTAVMVTNAHETRMRALHDLPEPEVLLAMEEERLERSLSLIREKYPDLQIDTRLVEGEVLEQILGAADQASLVVCGSRGRGYLRGTFFGSTGREAVRQATRPTAVVRPRDGEDESADRLGV